MNHKERFIKTLKCEPIGGQVPTFELVFFLTMEAFGKLHPSHRSFSQWNQMRFSEKKLHMNDIAQLYVDIAKKYNHSAIFVQGDPWDIFRDPENIRWVLELIQEKTNGAYFIMMHGDPTWAIPDGEHMLEFSTQMYEAPEKLNDVSKRRLEYHLDLARKLNDWGHLLDGFALCSDYCFNVNPFFSPDMFDTLISPFLKAVIDGYREMGYYSIKHTDGNIMPIVRQLADCGPDALHSLDPQGGVSIPEVRKLIGDGIALIGNVNCGLLQTGTVEECRQDILRALREGMERGCGYIFSTSNCAYTGLPLERYEMMLELWKHYGNYDDQDTNL